MGRTEGGRGVSKRPRRNPCRFFAKSSRSCPPWLRSGSDNKYNASTRCLPKVAWTPDGISNLRGDAAKEDVRTPPPTRWGGIRDPLQSNDNRSGGRCSRAGRDSQTPRQGGAQCERKAALTEPAEGGVTQRRGGMRLQKNAFMDVARSVLSSPLSSRARRSLPLRWQSAPSARKRRATWHLRRGSPCR